MPNDDAPMLAYETPYAPNPWALPTLIVGVVLLLVAVVPIVGLIVVPFACIALIAGITVSVKAHRHRRRGLGMSVIGSLLCLLAMLLPFAMLGTVPFLAHAGLKALLPNKRTPTTLPATVPAKPPATTRGTGTTASDAHSAVNVTRSYNSANGNSPTTSSMGMTASRPS